MINSNPNDVQIEIYIQCQPETLFSFFTDPGKMKQWMGKNIMLEPTVGGHFRIDLNGHDVALGEYLEVDPFKRIVMTFGWERSKLVPPGASKLIIELLPEQEGTKLIFIHADLPEEERVQHAKGWQQFMQALLLAAEGKVPGVDSLSESM
jgi:uncharacterized protein YndB with AHSA1/START domain